MPFGGTYIPSSPPQRAGTFIVTRTVTPPQFAAGAAGTVGLVVQSDWGPDNTITTITSAAQGAMVFGNTGNAAFAISQALLGEGSATRTGASVVKAYRAVGAAGARAAVTLDNTAAADALTITAKYMGTRGNNLNVTHRVNDDTVHRDLVVYEGTTLRETYTYTPTGGTQLASLAATINAQSNYITATVVADGTALATTGVVNVPLTGGDSGTVLIAGDHTDAQSAFETDAAFTAFAVWDWDALSGGVQDTYRDWAVRLVESGILFTFVVGGAVAELSTDAVDRSVYLDTPDVDHIYGEGEVFVNISRDLNVGGTVYSSSRMAPRVAGIIAAADAGRSITGATLANTTLANPPSSSQVEVLVAGGVVPFVNDGGLVRLQRGRTAYGAATLPAALPSEKNEQYRSLLFVRRLWNVFNSLDDLVSLQLTGTNLVNNSATQAAIIDLFVARLRSLEGQGIINPGYTVQLDTAEDNTGEVLHLLMSFKPAPGIEQVLIQLSIPLS